MNSLTWYTFLPNANLMKIMKTIGYALLGIVTLPFFLLVEIGEMAYDFGRALLEDRHER